MQIKTSLLATLALAASATAFGSGFALYEPSVVSHAMGGALVGKAMDASANVNNPATLTDLTNIEITVGFVTEHPRAVTRAFRNYHSCGDQTVDPGLFWLPHFQLALPLPAGLTFGLSGSAEYGLGTEYGDGSALAWNAKETTVQGYVLNPNLAYKITDKWSVAAGLRWLFFDFEQYKNLHGCHPLTGADLGVIHYRLHGDNRCESLGWQVGTKYDILDNLAVGLVYKTALPVDVRGYTTAETTSPYLKSTAAQMNGPADAQLDLPQSLACGVNWDVVRTWHLGAALSWTQWSEFDTLLFNIQPQSSPVSLDWNDTYRASIGSCWDFIEDWKWMISYTFDMDCASSHNQTSVMLPPAHRNILATGFAWNCWAGLELALSYACIFMDGGSMDFTDTKGVSGKPGSTWHVETSRGFCHAAGFSVTYRF